MNRAEIRRQAKATAKMNNKLFMTVAEIEKIKKEAATQAMDKAFVIMMSMPLMVLRDKYGFGEKRLNQFSDYLFDLYNCFDTGHVTFDDLIKILKDEVGVIIKYDPENIRAYKGDVEK